MLTQKIVEARRLGATKEKRESFNRAQLRMDEMAKAIGIPERFERNDSKRNVAVETAFVTAYQLVDSQDEKDAVLAAYMLWESDEKGERSDIREGVQVLNADMARNNDVWIDNKPVPEEWLHDGCSPSGRAA